MKRIPKPSVENDVPYCTRNQCPLFDGRNCHALGHGPDSVVCLPAVQKMLKRNQELAEALDFLGEKIQIIEQAFESRGEGYGFDAQLARFKK